MNRVRAISLPVLKGRGPGPVEAITGQMPSSIEMTGLSCASNRLTAGLERNHVYARRPVNAHPSFNALWAVGDMLKPSDSYLYFTDRDGTAVWRLPRKMSTPSAKPERLALPEEKDTGRRVSGREAR